MHFSARVEMIPGEYSIAQSQSLENVKLEKKLEGKEKKKKSQRVGFPKQERKIS